jgi:hypothetical protein
VDPKYRNAALGFGGLAAVVLVIVLVTGRGNGDVTCALTTASLGAVVTGVTEGRGAQQIVATGVAGIAVPLACKPLVESLIEEPESEVTFELEDPTTGTDTETATGSDLLAPPPDPNTTPQPSGTTISEMLACARWRSNWLFNECINGTIGPPPTF